MEIKWVFKRFLYIISYTALISILFRLERKKNPLVFLKISIVFIKYYKIHADLRGELREMNFNSVWKKNKGMDENKRNYSIYDE
jgi:hypothetical protein